MDKVLSMIGLAKRAGKVSTGEFMCMKSIKNKCAKLIIIASNSSDNTKKSLINSCKYYKVQYIEYGTMAELGNFTGGGERCAVSINDDNFKKSILTKIQQIIE